MQIVKLMFNRLFVLSAINALFAMACVLSQNLDDVADRAGDERPVSTAAVTLPPIWTPTAVPNRAFATPLPIVPTQALPTLDPEAPGPQRPEWLTTNGPTILYCDADGSAALLDNQGERLGDLGTPCLEPESVTGEGGFALFGELLFQLPDAEIVQWIEGEPVGWSDNGNALVVTRPSYGLGFSKLSVYTIDGATIRRLTASGGDARLRGVSPEGSWIVYLELRDSDPPGKLMAAASDGTIDSLLFNVYDLEGPEYEVVGWLSESSVVLSKSIDDCGRLLMRANTITGSVGHLYEMHASAAVDDSSGTVFVLAVEDCRSDEPETELIRLTSLSDWEPQLVEFPTALVGDHRIERIEWIDDLDMLAVWVKSKGDPRRSGIVVYSTDGDIQYVFTTYGDQPGSMGGIFPSPDRRWILVGAPSPHGTRLFDSDGTLIKQFTAGGALADGVRAVQWTADSSSFFMIPAEGSAIYRADGTRDWAHPLVTDSISVDSYLMLVNPPEAPYRRVCPDEYGTRLRVGDRVEVGQEPDVPNRIREAPHTSARLLDTV